MRITSLFFDDDSVKRPTGSQGLDDRDPQMGRISLKRFAVIIALGTAAALALAKNVDANFNTQDFNVYGSSTQKLYHPVNDKPFRPYR
jgi:hypothetical protein